MNSKIADLILLFELKPEILFTLVYRAMTDGIYIVIKDRALFLDLLCKVSYEAIDCINFAEDLYRIMELNHSILPLEKRRLIKYLSFF